MPLVPPLVRSRAIAWSWSPARRQRLTAVCGLAFALLVPSSLLPGADTSGPADSAHGRLATFDTAAGETYFALSLMPDVEPPAKGGTQIVVLFDTSASQTGLYRETGLDALKTMLASLGAQSRVKLMAVDIAAVPATDGFVAPGGPEAKRAVGRLAERTPLGATDMNGGLRAAAKALAERTGTARAIVYIGDGLSRANILQPDEFRALLKTLVSQRVAVSSFAVGPERDVQLLAALANHTGGMVFVDTNESNVAHRAGIALARAAEGVVLWPVSADMPQAMREVYPKPVPPFRLDRDTILIGVLAHRERLPIRITVELAGNQSVLEWKFTPEPSSEEFGFLVPLVAQARDTDGLTLPTVGSAGLRETGRVILAEAENLVEVAARALKMGDIAGAERVVDSVLRRDPTNPEALVLKRAIQKKKGQKPDDTGLILKLPPPAAGGDAPRSKTPTGSSKP